jgi:hypothetical protein
MTTSWNNCIILDSSTEPSAFSSDNYLLVVISTKDKTSGIIALTPIDLWSFQVDLVSQPTAAKLIVFGLELDMSCSLGVAKPVMGGAGRGDWSDVASSWSRNIGQSASADVNTVQPF